MPAPNKPIIITVPSIEISLSVIFSITTIFSYIQIAFDVDKRESAFFYMYIAKDANHYKVKV